MSIEKLQREQSRRFRRLSALVDGEFLASLRHVSDLSGERAY